MSPMQIEYYTKNVYGNQTTYLADPRMASLWHRMTGKITINETDMFCLKEMFNAEFVRIFEPVGA